MNIFSSRKENERTRTLVGIVLNCASELKLLLAALFFLCSIATAVQLLLPRFAASPAALRGCHSNPTTPLNLSNKHQDQLTHSASQKSVITSEWLLENGAVKRSFHPYGSAAYSFILMSAYRGGPATFAVVGLSSKPLHLYGKPTYQCFWIPHSRPLTPVSAAGRKILPDWGYGRVYTVVVINCTFPTAASSDGAGGRLLVHAISNDGALNTTDTVLALNETPQDFANFTAEFSSDRPKYDYLYCGSPLYGNLSPQRVREWLAYHVRLFGSRSHFVIHDAGGVHDGVMRVLRPWMEKGFVSLQDVREQEKFDGYYHNQFLIVNDCLHRYRFAAKWMFFFDLDEFIYLPNENTIESVLDSLSSFTQFTFDQMTMSSKLCLSQDATAASRKWGFEKLVYRDVKRGIRRDRKYAVQPRNVFATGVHMSQNMVGETTNKIEGRIKYFHYHGTISERHEPCRQYLNSTQTIFDGVPYVLDASIRNIAGAVKRFEHETIGSRLRRTQQ